MQIVMAVSGTRGDVQPAVVLGAELALRGHAVVMAVPPNLVSFARGAGLETVPFGYDTREHMNSDLVRHGVSQGSVADRARAVARLWNFGWDQMVRELTDVILPERNRPDLDDLPEDVREQMKFHPVMTIGEVLELALEPAPAGALA